VTRGAAVIGAAVLALAAGARATAADDPPIAVVIEARSLTPGELIVFTVNAKTAPTSVRVHLFDKDIPAFKSDIGAWRALAGIDLDQKPGSYVATIDALGADGPFRVEQSIVVQSRRYPTRQLRVDPRFVEPPPAVLKRIEKEQLFLRESLERSDADRLWSAPFVRPVAGRANSRFGTRSVFNGKPRGPHRGADFLSPTGEPIKSPNAGRIVVARDLYFTGNTVVIDHGLGLFSMLAHLSRIDVRESELVAAGQIVGLVGATGRVTGPHLHWTLSVSGARVDPLALLALLGESTR
jgi:murein DD-endopeptidase MepM/ murein hydrolase activator NlpD